jgi:hypothetical protein
MGVFLIVVYFLASGVTAICTRFPYTDFARSFSSKSISSC